MIPDAHEESGEIAGAEQQSVIGTYTRRTGTRHRFARNPTSRTRDSNTKNTARYTNTKNTVRYTNTRNTARYKHLKHVHRHLDTGQYTRKQVTNTIDTRNARGRRTSNF